MNSLNPPKLGSSAMREPSSHIVPGGNAKMRRLTSSTGSSSISEYISLEIASNVFHSFFSLFVLFMYHQETVLEIPIKLVTSPTHKLIM